MKINSLFTILKKELRRFFTDRRMLATIFLPGILIYLIYSLMGEFLLPAVTGNENYIPKTVVVNASDDMRDLLSSQMQITVGENGEIESIKQQIKDEEIDLLIVFPDGFDEALSGNNPMGGENTPNVKIYYNSINANSAIAYSTLEAVLDAFESSLANKFDVNLGGEQFDMATSEDMSGMIMTTIMPMLLMVFLFTGCLAVGPESIAGEKERGTIAALLVTPVKRSHIALGKIGALSVVSLLCGVVSATGVILSLPKLMSGSGATITGSGYEIGDYALLFAVIISTVLLLVSIVSIVSAFAKSVKEAQGYSSPIMILSMLTGLSSMLELNGANIGLYFIPLLNSVQCMVGIFSLEPNALGMIVTIAANALYTGIAVFALTKMFDSEKIMFSK